MTVLISFPLSFKMALLSLLLLSCSSVLASSHSHSPSSSSSSPCSKPDTLTTLRVRGETNYEFGYNLGKASALQIAARMSSTQFQQNSAFAKTALGMATLTALWTSASSTFPAFVEEAQGMADGAGIDIFDIMVFNMYDELETIMPPSSSSSSSSSSSLFRGDLSQRDSQCTDILLTSSSSSSSRWIAHNEDARLLNAGLMFLLDATIGNASTSSLLQFSAYMYAGTLPSGAFAYVNTVPVPPSTHSAFFGGEESNAAASAPSSITSGLYFTLNGIFPLAINITGATVPRNFIHRSVLESTSFDDAIARLTTLPSSAVACGFSMNIGQVNDPQKRVANVETNAQGPSSVFISTPDVPYFHANMYRRVTTPQEQDASSIARLSRLNMLPSPTVDDVTSFFLLLGDTYNTTYPIYRPGIAPDCCATMITATFEVVASQSAVETGIMSLYMNNPYFCTDPIIVRQFP